MYHVAVWPCSNHCLLWSAVVGITYILSCTYYCAYWPQICNKCLMCYINDCDCLHKHNRFTMEVQNVMLLQSCLIKKDNTTCSHYCFVYTKIIIPFMARQAIPPSLNIYEEVWSKILVLYRLSPYSAQAWIQSWEWGIGLMTK